MSSRVLLNRGQTDVLVVAPHGNQDDDQNTDVLADVLATELKAYSVINIGWRRGEHAVLGENIANLNSIKHCKLGPCKRDFLDPLVAYKEDCISKFGRCHIFYIHGMSNKIRHKTKEDVDVVIGFGTGNPPSYTCGLSYKNALVTRLREEKFNVYQGKSGGRFSAWNQDNLTQLYRSTFLDHRVQSIQLEIVNLRRYDTKIAVATALSMARAFDRLLNQKTDYLKNMEIKEY